MATLLLLVALAVCVAAEAPRWGAGASGAGRWAVGLRAGAAPPSDAWLAAQGWRLAGQAHARLNHSHVVLAPLADPPRSWPSQWPQVLYAERLVARWRSKRGAVEDATREPLWGQQWHLHDFHFPSAFLPTIPAHISATDAWLTGALGAGVQIAVVDDGLQAAHPDLADRFDATGSYDFNEDRPSVEPSNIDAHGTEAAGTAAAGINGACGVGVAPQARLAGIRLLAGPVSDEQEALALSYQDQLNAVYSSSWGPIDDGQRLEGPGPLLQAAMAEAIATGRGGLGVIYVWAGGNGRQVGDNCNFDGYANSRYTLTVGAVDSLGRQSPYSEDCAALLVCAPSSGLSTNPYKIVTTDLLGRAGVSAGDCSITFGGTSAAAPVVAGAVALVLSANPALGWRDVQGILAASTDAIDDADPGWQLNGGGLRFNHKYGFGRVNASRAVTLAREWLIYGDEFTLTPGLTAFAPGAFESKARLSTNLRVEGVEVVFTARVARRGRLAVNLLSPFGTVSHLAPFHPDAAADYPGWRFGSVAHWGEASAGDWTLRLEADGGIPFSNASWTLLVYGRADPTLSAPGERL